MTATYGEKCACHDSLIVFEVLFALVNSLAELLYSPCNVLFEETDIPKSNVSVNKQVCDDLLTCDLISCSDKVF